MDRESSDIASRLRQDCGTDLCVGKDADLEHDIQDLVVFLFYN